MHANCFSGVDEVHKNSNGCHFLAFVNGRAKLIASLLVGAHADWYAWVAMGYRHMSWITCTSTHATWAVAGMSHTMVYGHTNYSRFLHFKRRPHFGLKCRYCYLEWEDILIHGRNRRIYPDYQPKYASEIFRIK